MNRSFLRSHILALLSAVAALVLLFGCSGGCKNPKDCQAVIFDALSEGNKDQFFLYVLDPPESVEDRDLVFEWQKSRFEPYFGGEVVDEYEVEGKVILSVACSSEYEDTHGTENTPPLLLAFENADGWKLDLKYTERINDLDNIFKELF